MKTHNVIQGTPEWLNLRIGVITASRFGDVMTTKQLKPARNAYIYELAAEIVSGEPSEAFISDAMLNGVESESLAREGYEFLTDVTVDQVGFISDDQVRFGCSPDGLIGNDGGLEIKCPGLKAHIEYLDKGVVPDKYLPQVYGSLYITGREWWDFMSYHSEAKELIVRTTKEDAGYKRWVEAFEPILKEYVSRLDRLVSLTKDHPPLAA
jgi:hypothetical protein